jgi:hypothetical protein
MWSSSTPPFTLVGFPDLRVILVLLDIPVDIGVPAEKEVIQ